MTAMFRIGRFGAKLEPVRDAKPVAGLAKAIFVLTKLLQDLELMDHSKNYCSILRMGTCGPNRPRARIARICMSGECAENVNVMTDF